MLSLNTIIAIDMGHTLKGADYGVVGIRPESELTREVGLKVISKLEKLGYKVVNCTKDYANSVSESLRYRYTTANNSKANIFISIHFNATFGGYGSEIYTYGGKQFLEAKNILEGFKNLGFRNRGIKDGKNLSVIRNTTMKSMLIECCFCDSPSDMNKYDAEKMSDIIVEKLTGKDIDIDGDIKEEKKVKNIVVYNNYVDKRAAEYLGDYLNCPCIAGNNPFDFSQVENVYAVGGGEFTSYVKKHIGKGKDRWGVIIDVLKFCRKI